MKMNREYERAYELEFARAEAQRREDEELGRYINKAIAGARQVADPAGDGSRDLTDPFIVEIESDAAEDDGY
ncbi:MAG: hypothetical protein WC457_03455 [Patescibacteria group bacterium]